MPINKVGTKGIADGSIASAEIADGIVTSAKLQNGAVTNVKLTNTTFTLSGTSVSLGGSTSIPNKFVDWQSVIVADGSTGTTGVAGRGYFINTTSAVHTFTLPASATRGDTIAIKDYAGTFATNNLTIARNGHNIQGVVNNSLISTNRASVVLVYVDVTRGWEFVEESNVADLQAATFISATGGTILTSGNYKTHVFTGDGCFVVSTVGNPIGGGTIVDYLVVSGGGGGNGAGGFRVSNCATRSGLPAPSMSPLVTTTGITVTTTSYPITVGGGGSRAVNGSNSIFSTITSAGGGGGIGASGGSGSSGQAYAPNPVGAGSGNTPPVNPPQGNPAGSLSNPVNPSGSSIAFNGGGGAGAASNNITITPGPGAMSPNADGGIGSFVTDNFFGPTAPSYGTPGPTPAVRYFAGGGAGFSQNNAVFVEGGVGGAGGGGSACAQPVETTGATNTGGGGAIGYSANGVAGGKGIVIIRYKFQ